jgi:TPP-dependent pyruvate/acetoin dehydrogenase alpha subunit
MNFDRAHLRKLYRDMLLIRRFEERVSDLFLQGEMSGTCHLCIGQEAVPVGVVAALRKDDLLSGTHRGHGHFLAKGGEPRRVLAEIFGREAGYSRGRGGSQHMASFDAGFLGSFGITGGSLPLATGAALALKQRKEPRVVAAMLGDGAANQGVFHECINLAVLWKLPIVYVCENNLYAMSMPFAESCPVPRLADRVKGFGLAASTVDGNDVLAVAEAASLAVGRARCGAGPSFLECLTYRFCGHSRSDQCLYRTREEEAQWKARCPVASFAKKLLADRVLSEKELEAVDADVAEELRLAEEFARAAPFPDPASLEQDVFEEGEPCA